MKNLTLIIPAKYEKESLPIFLKEIEKYECEKIVILKKEDIETIVSIQGIDCKILFQSGTGYGSAIIEGINAAERDFCCIINADGSMDPKYLETMLKLCLDKDMIFASRYSGKESGSDDDNLITLFGNKIFSFLGNLFFSLNLSDILFTYILAKTNSLKKLNLKSQDFRLCVEIPVKAKRNNMIFALLPSYERPRIGGKKKVNALRDGFIILIYMIKLFFNHKDK
jgi:glycosyltransferase involved in cell wall biosynthesis